MEDIERRTAADETPETCEYFDLIGGTGTGGLIAVMLGLLGLTIGECIELNTQLSKEIFRVEHVLAGRIPVGENQRRFDFALETKLKELIEQWLGERDHIMPVKWKPQKTSLQCRTFVVVQMVGNVETIG